MAEEKRRKSAKHRILNADKIFPRNEPSPSTVGLDCGELLWHLQLKSFLKQNKIFSKNGKNKLRPELYSTLVQRLQIKLCSFYSSKLQHPPLLIKTKDKTEKDKIKNIVLIFRLQKTNCEHRKINDYAFELLVH